MFLELPLLSYQDRLRTEKKPDGKVYLWCLLRRKYLVLQPEEVVRQLLIYFLIDNGYPAGRMSIEKGLTVYTVRRRYDLVIMDLDMQPFLVVECKSPTVEIGPASVDQAVLYNQKLVAPYLLITNGRQSLCVNVDQSQGSAELCSLPAYPAKQ